MKIKQLNNQKIKYLKRRNFFYNDIISISILIFGPKFFIVLTLKKYMIVKFS